MSPFYWVCETGDLGEETEFCFVYVISEVPVQYPRKFEVGTYTYKFKFKRKVESEDLSMEDSSVLVVIILWDEISCSGRASR